MIRPISLRSRLWLAGLIGVLLSSLAAAVLLGATFERAAQRAFDRTLDDDLDALIGLGRVAADGQVVLRREPSGERYERVFSGWYWQLGEGQLRRHSRSFWDAGSLSASAPASNGIRAYSNVSGPRHQQLRVAAQYVTFKGAASPQLFAVAGDLAEVRAEVSDFRFLAALAMAVIAATLLLVILIQVQFGLRPFQTLASRLHRIGDGEDLRIGHQFWPREIAPLALQIDILLDEHALRVQRAKHSAQDLAHALKTPLAVLSLLGQRGEDEMSAAIAAQVERMRAAIERHLAVGVAADSRKRTPVASVLTALVEMLRHIHADRGLTFMQTIDGDAVFHGSRDDLEEILGNLLDNACKWAASRISIKVSGADSQLHIDVSDDGPGMDAEQSLRAVNRGVRLDAKIPGDGLGLGIVDGIVRSYGGTLKFARADLGGLRAIVAFDGSALRSED